MATINRKMLLGAAAALALLAGTGEAAVVGVDQPAQAVDRTWYLSPELQPDGTVSYEADLVWYDNKATGERIFTIVGRCEDHQNYGMRATILWEAGDHPLQVGGTMYPNDGNRGDGSVLQPGERLVFLQRGQTGDGDLDIYSALDWLMEEIAQAVYQASYGNSSGILGRTFPTVRRNIVHSRATRTVRFSLSLETSVEVADPGDPHFPVPASCAITLKGSGYGNPTTTTFGVRN